MRIIYMSSSNSCLRIQRELGKLFRYSLIIVQTIFVDSCDFIHLSANSPYPCFPVNASITIWYMESRLYVSRNNVAARLS